MIITKGQKQIKQNQTNRKEKNREADRTANYQEQLTFTLTANKSYSK